MKQILKSLPLNLLVATLLLLPSISQQFGVAAPLARLLTLPAMAFEYAAVAVHEMGHTVSFWSFGYPAFPALDFKAGGGMTYSFDRQAWAVAVFYALMAAATVFFLWRRAIGPATSLGLLTGLHALLSAGGSGIVVSTYMGHGMEVMLACALLLRGHMMGEDGNLLIKSGIVVTGYYILGRNLLMSTMLLRSNIDPDITMQGSNHITGDFTKIAQATGFSELWISALSLVFMTVCCLILMVAGIAADKERSFDFIHEDDGEKPQPVEVAPEMPEKRPEEEIRF